jgi:hypothetical protein
MVNILVIAVLIIPWMILPYNSLPDCTRLIKGAFFDLTMLGIIVMTLKNGLRFHYTNKYLSWLSTWIFFTFIFNWYLMIDLAKGYNASTIDSMIHTLLAIIATVFVCSNFERIEFIRLAKAICISATLVSIFGIFQAVGLDPMKHVARYGYKEVRHIAALLDNPDLFSNYLCMTIPLFLYMNKPRYYVCMGLCLLALLFAQSSISIIATFAGVICYLFLRFYKSKKIVLALIATVVLFLSFCVMSPKFNKIGSGFTGRINVWKMIVERGDNPLFGQGLGSVKNFNIVIGDNSWIYAHNDYLEIYASLGALGLFFTILYLSNLIIKFNYSPDNKIGFAFYSSLIAFLVIMFGSFPMEFPPVALNGLIALWALEKT